MLLVIPLDPLRFTQVGPLLDGNTKDIRMKLRLAECKDRDEVLDARFFPARHPMQRDIFRVITKVHCVPVIDDKLLVQLESPRKSLNVPSGT